MKPSMRATRIGASIAAVGLSTLLFPALLAAQRLEGAFYPSRQSYLLGEPLFVVFEVVNKGEEPTGILLGATSGQCALAYGLRVEVSGAERDLPWPRGCAGGFAGSCLGGRVPLAPKQSYTRRYLLNDWYRFPEPGRYHVHIAQELQVWDEDDYTAQPLGTIESEFTLVIEQPEEESVKRAYEPVLADLRSDDPSRNEALHALDQMAPTFLKDLILELSRSSDLSQPVLVLSALEKLNTARTRAELARLAEHSEWQKQPAIFALGRLRDRSYFPLMQKLAGHPDRAVQHAAIRSLGELGGEDALPFLWSLLRHPDPLVRHDAVFGLANTGSRDAVPTLIEMLRDSAEMVRQSAANALPQLTHRSLALDAGDPQRSNEAAQRWLRWWLLSADKAEVFGPDECGELKPLD
ncbi:MAG: HEAT repeat domain-containing protein [Acidobacteria bacterium]|nr:HEAT repeat domain-containing protein [Acidobacteriota bacterium]